MPFDAIIFDMDGVLVDSEPLGLEAMRRVMARHGVAYTEVDNEQFLGVTTPESCRVLKARHGLLASETELAREYVEHMIALISATPRPMPGVPTVLAKMHGGGRRMALASSAEPQLIATNLSALDLHRFFEVVVSGVEVGRSKPAPDIFLETARRLGVAPPGCLVVEDSRNGLLAAKSAGMACAVVPCAATRHQDFGAADYSLEALSDLLGVL
ncbi:MAG TPA: HAD family phosphatase [Methylomirabilota bacterium]|jgi:HAD superfamily hydrolase (TIGR01509 family)|nr:HAD family phosphatase [Methylomirabilota bacterium]